ncbi:MAG: site-specific integrase [Treponema sp.]|nr:site-specific integrase [Treponema sp.]
MRKHPSGKKVVFYYAYDEEGVRRGPWTTKCLNKTLARNYCHKLIRKGALIPDGRKPLTFAEYAEGFWERGSVYVENQESRAYISDSYMATSKSILEHQIMPFFGKVPLEKITSPDVNKWLLGFSKREARPEGGGKEPKRYKNTYANSAFRTLNVMLQEAVRRGLLQTNPCANVRRLKNDRKDIEILTVEEVQRLFPENYRAVWGGKEIAYAANRLASLTGMRAGEILGLRGEFVFDDYILVCGQYGQYGYKGHTKTRENRTIPVMPEMMALLRKLTEHNGRDFVFSLDGGVTPVSRNNLYMGLREALNKIGIDDAEIKRRGLTLHGWRHFLNTELQRLGLTVPQVQSVTGHRSDRMTEWYSHPDARQLEDVVKAQEAIAGISRPDEARETASGGTAGFRIVKRTDGGVSAIAG